MVKLLSFKSGNTEPVKRVKFERPKLGFEKVFKGNLGKISVVNLAAVQVLIEVGRAEKINFQTGFASS